MPRNTSKRSLADDEATPGGAAAVDRALTILGAFRAEDGSLSLADLSSRTGLYKSTVLRLIASLHHHNFLGRLPDGRYALGLQIPRLHGVYTASFSLEKTVVPALTRLVEKTGESAAFHVMQPHRDELVRLCLFRVDSPHPVRDHIRAGDVLPSDRGTGARILRAFNPELNDASTPAEQSLYERIREDGYYASRGDRLAEVAGISAPVFRRERQIAAALTLTMPAHRFTRDHIEPVVQAAQLLSTSIPD